MYVCTSHDTKNSFGKATGSLVYPKPGTGPSCGWSFWQRQEEGKVVIRLMEKILHMGCPKIVFLYAVLRTFRAPHVVQDFFHQQY